MLSFGFRIFCWYRGFCHRTGSDLLLFLFRNPTSEVQYSEILSGGIDFLSLIQRIHLVYIPDKFLGVSMTNFFSQVGVL